MKQRLAAILAADVAGYSRLMSLDERATVVALDAARAVFRLQIEANQGRVIDMAGDSVLAVFETATGAVTAALAVQLELATQTGDVPEERRMRFRIGVHLGDVIEKGDGSIYGDGVNIAARLEGLADPGGITVSESVQIAVRGRVAASFEDMGEQQSKNLAAPVRAWRMRNASDLAVAPATPAKAAPPAREFQLALPDRPSIAVLPFTNMSGDPEQEYFTDGMVEDIITELSRFQRLFVIARNTSFTYRGKNVDVKKVAQELGVHFVLEGSVRKAGDRVRITAQLIDGETGHHVWAERYEDVMTDIFELQERITRQVVSTMVPEIEAEEMRLLGRGQRRFSEVDDMAWRAAKAMTDAMFGGSPALTLEAIELAQQAIRLDRNCPMAWYVLTNSHAWRVFMAWTDDRAASIAAAQLAAEALMRLAPNDSRSYFQRGVIEGLAGESSRAATDLRRAHELNPNDAVALFFLCYYEASAGNTERAKELATRAIRMSPKDRWVSTAHLARAVCAFIEGDLQSVHDWADLAIQAQATHPIRRVLMIAFAAEVGDAPLLRKHLGRLQSVAPDFIPSLFRGDYRPLQRPEHMKMLLDRLRKAGLGGADA